MSSELNHLLSLASAGKMSRREFVGRAGALGAVGGQTRATRGAHSNVPTRALHSGEEEGAFVAERWWRRC